MAALSRNIARNNVSDRVEVHRIAFSNAESEAYFETTPSTWLSGLRETGTERVSVRTLSADFQERGLEHVSVLRLMSRVSNRRSLREPRLFWPEAEPTY